MAGARKLVENGIIRRDEVVCGILTGHLLKDPDVTVGYHKGELAGIDSNFSNRPIKSAATLRDVLKAIE